VKVLVNCNFTNPLNCHFGYFLKLPRTFNTLLCTNLVQIHIFFFKTIPLIIIYFYQNKVLLMSYLSIHHRRRRRHHHHYYIKIPQGLHFTLRKDIER
jgi:hypothetical protein